MRNRMQGVNCYLGTHPARAPFQIYHREASYPEHSRKCAFLGIKTLKEKDSYLTCKKSEKKTQEIYYICEFV